MERRIGPCPERELGAGREPLDEIVDHRVTTLLGYQVNVVEHEHERSSGLDAGIEKCGNHEILER